MVDPVDVRPTSFRWQCRRCDVETMSIRYLFLTHRATAQAFVHVSTAYCNCDRAEVSEVVYAAPTDPEKLVQCVDWMDADMAEHMTPK